MSRLAMVGCVADGNVILSLDDPAVWEDEGESYDAYGVINPINFGKTAPRGRLRRITQAVTINGDATITVTPLGDGDEFTGQAVSQTISPADRSTHLIEAEVAVDGQRFAYKFQASEISGLVQFGEADVELIPKRTA